MENYLQYLQENNSELDLDMPDMYDYMDINNDCKSIYYDIEEQEQDITYDTIIEEIHVTKDIDYFDNKEDFLIHTQPVYLIDPGTFKFDSSSSDNSNFSSKNDKIDQFCKLVNSKLSRYHYTSSDKIDQDDFDNRRFQEISYKFSKTYY